MVWAGMPPQDNFTSLQIRLIVWLWLQYTSKVVSKYTSGSDRHCWISLFWKRDSGIHCVKSVEIRSFFWYVFSRICTEYGEIRSISPYSVQMRENTDQKKLRIWTLFRKWQIFDLDVLFKKVKYFNQLKS